MTMRTPRRQAIWDMTSGRCFYCGCELVADDDRIFAVRSSGSQPPERQMEVDHRHSIKHGGADSPDNTVPACGGCNVRKGAKTVEDFRIYLMLAKGRPPDPFYGENSSPPKRDWLIVASAKIRVPHEPYGDRLAVYRGGAIS